MFKELLLEKRTTTALAAFSAVLVLIGAMQGLIGFGIMPAQAADTVVAPGSLGDWQFQFSGTASGNLVTGPGSPPMGSGSLRLASGSDGNSGAQFRNDNENGTELDDLTELRYFTYVTENSTCQAPYIILDIDQDNDGDVDDLLFFEPCYQNGTYTGSTVPNQGNVTEDAWQEWNALTGGWWSNDSGNGGPPLVTIDDYLDGHPNARIRNGSAGGVRIVAGFGAPSWNNFVGYADAFSIGVNGNTTRYDFENVTSSSASSSLSSASSSISSSISSLSSSSSHSSLSSSSSWSSASFIACTTPSGANILAHWPFNEGSGTTANDIVNNHDGTLINMEPGDWVSATQSIGTANPFALDFDGTTGNNEHVHIGSGQIIGSDASFTIAGWVNMDDFTSAQNPLYGEFNTNGHTRNYLGVGGDRRVFFDQYTPSGGGLFSNSLLNSGQWYHIAYVQSGSIRTLFVNGTPDISDSNAESYSGTTPNFIAIGGRPGPSPYYVNGKMDDLRLYGRSLTTGEIRSLANRCGSSASSLSQSSTSSRSSRSSVSSSGASSGGFGQRPSCNSFAATIYIDQNNRIVGGPDNGRRYSGVLRGTRGNDVMVGTNGRDLMLGGIGNDTMCGGGGSDRIFGGLGEDKIGGESGSDLLDGGNGKDILCGHADSDRISGGNSNDSLDGGSGTSDRLDGDNSRDTCANGDTLRSCELTSSGITLCTSLITTAAQ